MITLTRPLVRQVRTVFRFALGTSPRGPLPAVLFRADQHGLTIRSKNDMAAIEYSLPGEYPADELVAPGDLLLDCEGRSDEVVSIERGTGGQLTATWRDSGTPVLMQYASASSSGLDAFSVLPDQMADNPISLLAALRDASQIAQPASTRFALDHLELCGDSGTVTATDGNQVLVRCDRSPTEPPPPTEGLLEARET